MEKSKNNSILKNFIWRFAERCGAQLVTLSLIHILSKIQHDVMLRVVKILNVLMIELPFAGCWFLYYSHQTLSLIHISFPYTPAHWNYLRKDQHFLPKRGADRSLWAAQG